MEAYGEREREKSFFIRMKRKQEQFIEAESQGRYQKILSNMISIQFLLKFIFNLRG